MGKSAMCFSAVSFIALPAVDIASSCCGPSRVVACCSGLVLLNALSLVFVFCAVLHAVLCCSFFLLMLLVLLFQVVLVLPSSVGLVCGVIVDHDSSVSFCSRIFEYDANTVVQRVILDERTADGQGGTGSGVQSGSGSGDITLTDALAAGLRSIKNSYFNSR